MLNIKTFLKTLFIISLFFALPACHSKSNANSDTIKVGVIAGPENQLMEAARRQAITSGLKIKIITFNDYNMPNTALADGSIDANMFQHQPYLDSAIKMHGYKLVSIGKTFIYPMGLYSKKFDQLLDVPHGATVGIPNDPSNQARALLLLQKAGLIVLKPGVTVNATIKDIADNLRQLHFKELDAAQLPRSLQDLDLAAINTNFAMLSGLLPSRDALATETTDSPYANIVVIRASDENDPRFKKLMDALHSTAVLNQAKALFKKEAIPAWK